MDEVLLRHTWNVHHLSGLSSSVCEFDVDCIPQYEKDVTKSIQRDRKRKKRNADETATTGVDDCYATVQAIEEYTGSSLPSPSSLSQEAYRMESYNLVGKKRSLPETRIPIASTLLVKVYLAEAWSSEVVMILGKDDDEPSICLVRGNQSFYSVLRWIQDFDGSGGILISQSWKPSSTELRDIMLHWLIRQDRGVDDNITSLSLTFETPPEVTKIDQISLTVPSAVISELCRGVEQNLLTTSSKKQDIRTSVWKQLKFFLLEAFGVDVTSFPLKKATNGMASLSLDGRVKPIAMASKVIDEILATIRQRKQGADSNRDLEESLDESGKFSVA